MPRYCITIEYDGSQYCGLQNQQENPTIKNSQKTRFSNKKQKLSIAKVLELAIYQFSGKKVTIYFAGRTDAGVHAIKQIGHFDLELDLAEHIQTKSIQNYKPEKILLAINHYLISEAIKIVDCKIVDDNFHARFSAKSRQYCYRILNRKSPPVLEKNHLWHIPQYIDFKLLKITADIIVKNKNLTAFLPQKELKNLNLASKLLHLKDIDYIEIKKIDEIIEIRIKAKSFFRHLVRSIVGAMIWVAIKKITIEELEEFLQKPNITEENGEIVIKEQFTVNLGPIAPPFGLFFEKAEY